MGLVVPISKKTFAKRPDVSPGKRDSFSKGRIIPTVTADQYKLIRKASRDGWSRRKAARVLGIARQTVGKYWDGSVVPQRRHRNEGTDGEDGTISGQESRQNNIKSLMVDFLEKNKDRVAKKHKITIKMIHKAVNPIIHVGYSTLCRYYKMIKTELPEVYIPLEFEPGEVMQVDFCVVEVDINGVRHKCKLFCSVLGYSGKIFTMILPNEKQDCFFYALIEAFKYYGGVPKKIFLDNCRTVVQSGSGKNAKTNEAFKTMEAHYGFEGTFMNAASGNEKGLVENLCQTSRRIAFTPIVRAGSLKEVQESTHVLTNHYNNTHTKKYKKSSIYEMGEVEKASLEPLPKSHIKPFKSMMLRADKSLLINYNGCKYSIPYKYANKQIVIKPTPYQIFCLHKDELIATHTVSLVQDKKIYIAEHYLDILVNKPRAVEHAQPLKQGVLPPELDQFRNKCSDNNKLEQIVNILLLCRQYDETMVLNAVGEANEHPNPTYNAVTNYLKLRLGFSGDHISNNLENDSNDDQKDSLKIYDDLMTDEDDKN
jgi:transposase